MFTLELNQRMRHSKLNVASLIAHPGLARTNLQSTSIALNRNRYWHETVLYKLMGPLFQSAIMGALPQLFAATEPKLKVENNMDNCLTSEVIQDFAKLPHLLLIH